MNNQTKRLKEIMIEIDSNMKYDNLFAITVYTHIINNYYYVRDSGSVRDIDNRVSDVLYALVTLYGFGMEEISSRIEYILHNLNAPYEVSVMIMVDAVMQLRKFDISTDDIFLFEVHQAIYNGVLELSKGVKND